MTLSYFRFAIHIHYLTKLSQTHIIFIYIPQTKTPLGIINLNCQSLKNKKAEFVSLIDSTKPDIIIDTNSRLSNSISDAEYFPDKFNVYRNDRSEDQRGGGVFVAVNSDLISEE